MKVFIEYLLVAVVTWAQVTAQSNAPSGNVTPNSDWNKTTTAVPLLTATVKNDHTPIVTSTQATPSTTVKVESTTKAIDNSGSTMLTKLASIVTSAAVTDASPNSTPKVVRNYPTTSAAPPVVGPAPSHRHFDALSFMGGVLLTVSVVILGTYAWKMYMARIDRSYWTL